MSSPQASKRTGRFAEAVLSAQRQALGSDADVILLGENVGRMGGLHGSSQGLLEEFGPKRVIDTPISDASAIGLASGLALVGKKVIVELSGPDRLAACWEVLRLELANLQSRSNGAFASTVILRVPAGRGIGGGRYLEAAPEGNLSSIDGLRVLAPSSGTEAGGMLLAALQAPGPTVILESNALLHSRSAAPAEAHAIEGAEVLLPGEDLTILTYGGNTRLALQLAQRGEKEGFSAEVVDLRSLRPLDVATIGTSVQKTGHILFLHESEALAERILRAVFDSSFLYLEAPPALSMSDDIEALVDVIWENLDY